MQETPEHFLNYRGKKEYENQGGWATLPQEILEECLDRIAIRYRYRASMACKSWYNAFKSAGAWRTFVYRDLVFTRRRFTIHSGWQPMIDHYRLRFLVNLCTRRWRSMIIKPVTLLFNLYEFLRVLTNFSEYYENENDNPLCMMKSFEFNWSLKFQTSNQKGGPDIYGTGGQVLKVSVDLKKRSVFKVFDAQDQIQTYLAAKKRAHIKIYIEFNVILPRNLPNLQIVMKLIFKF